MKLSVEKYEAYLSEEKGKSAKDRTMFEGNIYTNTTNVKTVDTHTNYNITKTNTISNSITNTYTLR